MARARECIQQQAHSSSPSRTGSTRSRTSQLTSGQTAQSQSLLPGMRQYELSMIGQADPVVQMRQQRQPSTRSPPLSSIYREIQPAEPANSETSSVSFIPKRQRSPEGAPIPQRSASAIGTSTSGRRQLTPSGPVTVQSRATRWLDRNATPADMKVIKREQKRSESVVSWMMESQRADIAMAESQRDLLVEQLNKANRTVELI